MGGAPRAAARQRWRQGAFVSKRAAAAGRPTAAGRCVMHGDKMNELDRCPVCTYMWACINDHVARPSFRLCHGATSNKA